MILKMDKKKNISIIIFIAAALAAFLILSVLVVVLPMNYSLKNRDIRQNNNDIDYKVKSGLIKDDPFITPVPSLENYLDGPIISASDPQIGDAGAAVDIVYFSDYSCGFCREQEKVIKKAIDEYGSRIRLVWKDYPDLNDPASLAPARAARCAQMQNEFWPYHDRLYQGQIDDYSRVVFVEMAVDLGLDRIAFTKCLEEDRPDQVIQDNIEEAGILGISGIPYTFVNGREFLGELNYEELKQLIEFELARKGD